MPFALLTLLAILLSSAAGTAWAHDTWFQPVGPMSASPLLALGTGNRYPVHEFTVDPAHIARSGCRSGTRTALPLTPSQSLPKFLLLRAGPGHVADRALSCWAQLVPFDIELPQDKVAVYLDEIAAPQAVRAEWEDMKQHGMRWKERYTKNARIELLPARSAPVGAAPSGVDLEILLERVAGAVRVGEPVVARVRFRGQPLPGLALELVAEKSGRSTWLRTAGDGRMQFTVPEPGRWVLRGTHLRASRERPGTWDSDFVTLVFNAGAEHASPVP